MQQTKNKNLEIQTNAVHKKDSHYNFEVGLKNVKNKHFVNVYNFLPKKKIFVHFQSVLIKSIQFAKTTNNREKF